MYDTKYHISHRNTETKIKELVDVKKAQLTLQKQRQFEINQPQPIQPDNLKS